MEQSSITIRSEIISFYFFSCSRYELTFYGAKLIADHLFSHERCHFALCAFFMMFKAEEIVF